jgi:hypothetical protein
MKIWLKIHLLACNTEDLLVTKVLYKTFTTVDLKSKYAASYFIRLYSFCEDGKLRAISSIVFDTLHHPICNKLNVVKNIKLAHWHEQAGPVQAAAHHLLQSVLPGCLFKQ